MNTLGWSSIRNIGRADSANRWYPSADVAPYFSHIRSPSRAWPYSYAKAAQTRKFAAWLLVNRPAVAARLGVTV